MIRHKATKFDEDKEDIHYKYSISSLIVLSSLDEASQNSEQNLLGVEGRMNCHLWMYQAYWGTLIWFFWLKTEKINSEVVGKFESYTGLQKTV
jgi:hypothetical protein